MFGKKGSKILKLPPVRNCVTLAMTNKLVVIINSLKVPKIKKILLYEMKFLGRNYSCPPEPLTRGPTAPQIPFLSTVLNWICWTPSLEKKIPGYATGERLAWRLTYVLLVRQHSGGVTRKVLVLISMSAANYNIKQNVAIKYGCVWFNVIAVRSACRTAEVLRQTDRPTDR